MIEASELDWQIMVMLIRRSAREPNTRAAIPGTPAIPLPSTDTSAWSEMALMALTG